MGWLLVAGLGHGWVVWVVCGLVPMALLQRHRVVYIPSTAKARWRRRLTATVMGLAMIGMGIGTAALVAFMTAGDFSDDSGARAADHEQAIMATMVAGALGMLWIWRRLGARWETRIRLGWWDGQLYIRFPRRLAAVYQTYAEYWRLNPACPSGYGACGRDEGG